MGKETICDKRFNVVCDKINNIAKAIKIIKENQELNVTAMELLTKIQEQTIERIGKLEKDLLKKTGKCTHCKKEIESYASDNKDSDGTEYCMDCISHIRAIMEEKDDKK